MRFLVLVFICLASTAASSFNHVKCTKKLMKLVKARGNNYFNLKRLIRTVHPSQYLLGLPRIFVFRRQLKNASLEELQKILKEKRVPYVLGPRKKKWIIDRHHTLFTLKSVIPDLEAKGIDTSGLEIVTNQVLDLSHLSHKEFLDKMEGLGYIYPYTAGRKRNTYHIPNNIDGLEFDFLRGLVWLVRQSGAIKKSEIPFVEFKWAEYFYSLGSFPNPVFTKEVIERAIALAISPEGPHTDLPGFRIEPKEIDHYFSKLDEILRILEEDGLYQPN